jgi:hypothetical protein
MFCIARTGSKRSIRMFCVGYRSLLPRLVAEFPTVCVASDYVSVTAVQPDRDVTGKQRSPRSKKLEITSRTTSDDSSDWTMRLPLDVRSLMMHLMNIEAQVVRGQVSPYSQECPPIRNRKGTLRDIFEKTDMFPAERYEASLSSPSLLSTVFLLIARPPSCAFNTLIRRLAICYTVEPA